MLQPAAMLGSIALALAAQAPPVAVTNTPAPPAVLVPVPSFPKAAPMPPPGAAKIVRRPQARQRLQQLISREDYPMSALARREEGRVAFTLDVGENGRVTGCTITRSSGSAALDSSTCRLMRNRARFTPATDSNGMPAAGRVEDELVWKLPETAGPERG